MKKVFYLILLSSSIISCLKNEPKTLAESEPIAKIDQDVFYHYSIWEAFVNKIYDGTLKASELKERGTIGLGSYNALEGELVMLDGILYEALGDGSVIVVNDTTKIAYANAAFYKEDVAFKFEDTYNYEDLRKELNLQTGSKNFFYAFKIHGTFQKLKLGGVPKQEKPYTEGLDVLIPNRPVFDKENITGTMVGFYCPEFIGKINVTGYHLHFVSDDKKSAGHVMEFTNASDLTGGYKKISKYQFDLPETNEYEAVNLEKSFQYNKK
ncbi:acetolactate decarboxylase [Lutibacter agarilyticus]|uniref:Alpha-acetolactate decarboxylase n=1 Tax=Lutibacter agarilyticus TaxID=1109740 RepID=A0A238Z2G9_9FLAO|nr:acetolactate decarboxylase [Lutibacter agarilyticus]SNR77043.1 acetolactate decarboxylase [Lutibacter agarilyticus]